MVWKDTSVKKQISCSVISAMADYFCLFIRNTFCISKMCLFNQNLSKSEKKCQISYIWFHGYYYLG